MFCKNSFPDTKTYVLKFTEWRCKVRLFLTFLFVFAPLFSGNFIRPSSENTLFRSAIISARWFSQLLREVNDFHESILNQYLLKMADEGKLSINFTNFLVTKKTCLVLSWSCIKIPLLRFNYLPLIYLIRYRMRLILWKRIIVEDFIPVPAYR